MRFWIREILGWFLVALGLYIFFQCFELLLERHRIVEAGSWSIIGIVVFRGGIHLLKVAVAARICLHAQEQQDPERPTSAAGQSRSRVPTLSGRRS